AGLCVVLGVGLVAMIFVKVPRHTRVSASGNPGEG
ncbi:MAG: hypothetical protein K0R68_3869, partial [Mycobacterium sp.]|nr:hypothetical protein [Mycobacterium sp.]